MNPKVLFNSILVLAALALSVVHAAEPLRPNIVCIFGEDMGPDLGCWGVNVHTPNIDRLANEGMRFTHLFGTASVCMPNRTAMITGMQQNTIGAITMRPPQRFMRPLPGEVKPLPALLHELGYTCGNIKGEPFGASGKDDWNFTYDGKGWDTGQLAELPRDKPFYAQFNFQEAHRPYHRDEEFPVDPATVDLPPYYPDHPVARRSWADYLESIQHLDRRVGRVLGWLEKEGLADNTIVLFLSDHGEAFLRGKYFLYDCSLNQPLVIRWPRACHPPASFHPGSVSGQLIASIDIPAQTIACAGGEVPAWMHGRAFLTDDAPSSEAKPRTEVLSAADWYGGEKLKSRSIRTERYKYIRNFYTGTSVTDASTEYRIALHPMYHLVKLLDERGRLSPLHRKLLLDPLPDEELYDLQADPHELTNLADDAELAAVKAELSGRLMSWIETSGDYGFQPKEPGHEEHFDKYRRKQRKAYKKKREELRQMVLDNLGE